MAFGELVPDPKADAAGILGLECFLCGHIIHYPLHALWYGREGPMASLLPCHRPCLDNSDTFMVALEYHRRLADLIGARRIA